VQCEDIQVAKTQVTDGAEALVRISLAIDDFGLRRLCRREATLPEVQTLVIDNNQDLAAIREGEPQTIRSREGFVLAAGHIDELILRAFPPMKPGDGGNKAKAGRCA